MKQAASPLIVTISEKTIQHLEPRDMRSRNASGYNEHFIQTLVHNQPSVLPISKVEPVFSPLISVCMELPLKSGYLDNLLITPRGDLIAVECKLWRNPESRRTVIAQIIDYAKDLQAMTYEDLQNSIRQAKKDPTFNLYNHMLSQYHDPSPLSEHHFIDALSSNLRRSRCLLVIAGDGITENTETLTDFLQQHAGLHFALMLVCLSIYNLPESDKIIVVPSIPMRTINIVRGIVQFNEGKVSISSPAPTIYSQKPTTLSEDEIFAELDQKYPGTSTRLINFLTSCSDINIYWNIRKTIIVYMVVGAIKVTAFVVNSNGTVDFGYDFTGKHLTRPFMETLDQNFPNLVMKESPKSVFVKNLDGTRPYIWQLLDNDSGLRSALEILHFTLSREDHES
ncbi:hypothetical protein [Acetobacter sp. LMG 32666]|uniref:hypothetical protein n=1 Tax=Acetobacter sp. LMG 32666 TaxID=2959295 RepID=UPI0030C802C6